MEKVKEITILRLRIWDIGESKTNELRMGSGTTGRKTRNGQGQPVLCGDVNPLYRLGDVFGKLFDRNIEGYEQLREVFFDVCMHQIVRLDLREGLAKEDFYYSLIIQDIEEGRYGEQARERFSLFIL